MGLCLVSFTWSFGGVTRGSGIGRKSRADGRGAAGLKGGFSSFGTEGRCRSGRRCRSYYGNGRTSVERSGFRTRKSRSSWWSGGGFLVPIGTSAGGSSKSRAGFALAATTSFWGLNGTLMATFTTNALSCPFSFSRSCYGRGTKFRRFS